MKILRPAEPVDADFSTREPIKLPRSLHSHNRTGEVHKPWMYSLR